MEWHFARVGSSRFVFRPLPFIALVIRNPSLGLLGAETDAMFLQDFVEKVQATVLLANWPLDSLNLH
ncbi:hypothetical protein [Methylocaldum szegediense]|jgi:hypothetical protein|uniref:hypothetical protein n=1 Tax=Methylocaldum szegediense TaxID=73780 RepID=UPI0012EC11D2|nr:hypothetical protein [Methylocaldum szegediense]